MLTIAIVDLWREDKLGELTRHISSAAHDQLFHQLLGDRTPPLNRSPIFHVRERGAHNTHKVDALITPECTVLYRDGGVDQIRRDLSVLHPGMNALVA